MKRVKVRPVFWLLLIGATLLFVYSTWVDTSRLHLKGLYEAMNDQSAHLGAARRIRDEGRPDSGGIYPSVIAQDFRVNYFYMPGHAVVTAWSLRWLGDHPLAACLPNMLAYLLCIPLLYGIATRLASPRVGFAAGILFAAFPANVVFAVSAMSDLTFLASVLLAFAFFLYLPGRLRPVLGGVSLGLPFLFKEPGFLWILPMATVLWKEDRDARRRLVRLLVLVGAGLAVAYGVAQLPWVKGRPSRLLPNLLARSFEELYADAFATAARRPASWREWGDVLLARSMRNLIELGIILRTRSLESISLHLMLWPPILLALAAVRWLKPWRYLIVAHVLMSVALFGFFTVVYIWDSFGAARMLLMTYLLQCVLAGGVLDAVARSRARQAVILGLIAMMALPVLYLTARSIRRSDKEVHAISSVLKSIRPDPDGVLISPWPWGAVYLYEYYPARWAFIPANEPTLRLLHKKHPIATAVLSPADVQRLGAVALSEIGLMVSGEVTGPDGEQCRVYRRAESSGTVPEAPSQ